MNRGSAPAKQRKLPLRYGGETSIGSTGEDAPVGTEQLMECVVSRDNLVGALRQIKRNRGAPGIDGMTVEEFPAYLKRHWPEIRASLLEGSYKPQPVKRVEVPKPKGGVRPLGIPTVLDRFIQQALLQVLPPQWDATFSDHSFGFRPARSAHQAISRAQEYLEIGYNWVVDTDLEKFFERVNHDKLMSLIKERVRDTRVLKLIDRYLKSGVMIGGKYHLRSEGTPQGGPLSPLLANLLLDQMDKELEKRGHRFVRYTDDCNIYVRSKRAGDRVLVRVTKFLSRRLKLKVNTAKSAVERPWKRTFLGFTVTHRRPYRRKVSEESIKRLKTEVRRITRRTRVATLVRVISELRMYLTGWKAYFGINEIRYLLKELDSWIRRRLRCYVWKQWGRRRYRELCECGVSRDLAWNTTKSAHGPWRLSRSPALAFAFTAKYFASLGLPRLFEKC